MKMCVNACIYVSDNVWYKRKEKTEDKTLNIRHVTWLPSLMNRKVNK